MSLQVLLEADAKAGLDEQKVYKGGTSVKHKGEETEVDREFLRLQGSSGTVLAGAMGSSCTEIAL